MAGQARRTHRDLDTHWTSERHLADPHAPLVCATMSRRAKIVCTIGPVTATPEKIRELVWAGMDVARLNFSHGSHADHARVFSMIREASDEAGRAVGILADLQGPKIRLGRFATGPVQWRTGDEVRVTVMDVPGTHARVSTT